MKNLIIISLAFLVMVGCSNKKEDASIVTKEVSYTAEGTTLKGFLAYDENIEGTRPGVIVVHEWWGHNDYARKRAKMLAELGYTALAIDMYGDGKQANHPNDAGKFAMEIMQDMPAAKARFEAVQETAGVYSIVKETNCKFFDETERLKNPDPTPPVKS